jgi:hypothetical protein
VEITSSPGLPEPEEIRSFAVYDPGTGVIVHQHHVVRFPGAPERSAAELEERAVELARSQTGYEGPLAVLQVPHHAFDQPGRHRVHLETKQLHTEPHAPSLTLESAPRPRE